MKKTTLPNTAGRKKAQFKYNHQPAQIKRRSERNQARRKMEKEGKVHKGDNKDVDHKNYNTKNNSDKNLRVMSESANRSRNKVRNLHKKK